MSEFQLKEIYKLFISIIRNMVGLRVGFGAPSAGFKLPSSVLATASSKEVSLYVPIIGHLSILYAYCMFASCLFCVILIGYEHLALVPTSFHSFSPLSLNVRPICSTLAVCFCTITVLCSIGPFSPCPLHF